MRVVSVLAVGFLAVTLFNGCTGEDDDSGCSPPEDPEAPELSFAVCAPGAGPSSNITDHEFFPLPVGSSLELATPDGTETVRITALVDTMMVAGVNTRVIEDYETDNGELVETSRNFMVMTTDGTLCYYGETVDDYENGVIVGHSGEWQAGVNGALSGILLPATPAVGQWYRQEVALGIAEDKALHTAMGESVTFASGYTGTLTIFEWTPLECGTSDKVYARASG